MGNCFRELVSRTNSRKIRYYVRKNVISLLIHYQKTYQFKVLLNKKMSIIKKIVGYVKLREIFFQCVLMVKKYLISLIVKIYGLSGFQSTDLIKQRKVRHPLLQYIFIFLNF